VGRLTRIRTLGFAARGSQGSAARISAPLLYHSLGAIFYLQDLAERNDMIITAGSDFHRFEGGSHGLTSVYDYWQADSSHLRRIEEIIG